MSARVETLSLSATHSFSKTVLPSLMLLTGLGVEGDAHAGVTVKHRSRVRQDPTAPNLRQVHLVMNEKLQALAAQGFRVGPGVIGENITTSGIDLFALPRGATLAIGADAVIEVTGLRNPCTQLDAFQQGLMAATLEKDAEGKPLLRAGVMAIVLKGGRIHTGDTITLTLPPLPHHRLERV